MQAACCGNKPLRKATIKCVPTPYRRVSVNKRIAHNSSNPGRSGNGSGDAHTELRNEINIGDGKDTNDTIDWAASFISLSAVVTSWIQTSEMQKQTAQSVKQTVQIEQQTQIMRQDVDSVDLAGVAAIAKAVKNKQLEGSFAAHLLIQHGGLNRKEIVGFNKQIAKHVAGDDSIVEVTHRTTSPPAPINLGATSMATMSSSRGNWPQPPASTPSARTPIVWDLPFTLYSILMLGIAIASQVVFLGRIWRRHKARQNAKSAVKKDN